MRTGRLAAVLILILTLISTLGVPSLARAGEQPRAEPARSHDIVASVELWLLSAIERVEAIFGVDASPAPVSPSGGGTNSIQPDCRSGIDPNGGCTP